MFECMSNVLLTNDIRVDEMVCYRLCQQMLSERWREISDRDARRQKTRDLTSISLQDASDARLAIVKTNVD